MVIWKFLDTKEIKERKQQIEKNPENAEAHFYLGVEYERLGRKKEAISEFQEALKYNQNSAEIHFNLAVLFESQKDGKSAIHHIIQAGNLFSGKKDLQNHSMARKLLQEYYKKFDFKPDDQEDL